MSRPIVLALALALVGAGCGTGGLPSPSAGDPARTVAPPATTNPTAGPASPVVPTPAPVVTPTPVPTTEAGTGTAQVPPTALLAGADTPPGGAYAGALGTYSWDDQGSEAPWLVPPSRSAVAPRSAISVTFDPDVTPVTWVARWAPVAGDQAGDVAVGVDGTGAVTLDGPPDARAWSLQLEARFGDGRSATWYWRVEAGG